MTVNIKKYISGLWPYALPILFVCCINGCANNAVWLNSDRIEEAFGSYAVEILRRVDQRRVSSLFSCDGNTKTTRTYAVVDFAKPMNPALGAVHDTIVSGGSVGATFRRAGWQLEKQHMFIGEIAIPKSYEEIAQLMRIQLPAKLATHVYLLAVSNELGDFEYATITEIHHPEYLNATDLRQIYGEILLDDSNRDSIHDFIGPPNSAK